ncbi:MAG: hypothetical protein ACRC4N_08660, partial [Gammaproteobacteria bacterium]
RGDGGKEKLPEKETGRNLERNRTQQGTHPHLGVSRCQGTFSVWRQNVCVCGDGGPQSSVVMR